VEGLRQIVRRHVALAQELKGWIEQRPDFELMAPVPLSLVCFRYHPPGSDEKQLDALNERLLAKVNATRKVHLTHTRLDGRYVIRLVVGQRQTEREHVALAWALIREAAGSLA
jgi:aromatic-L-amino-acid decarboxylase